MLAVPSVEFMLLEHDDVQMAQMSTDQDTELCYMMTHTRNSDCAVDGDSDNEKTERLIHLRIDPATGVGEESMDSSASYEPTSEPDHQSNQDNAYHSDVEPIPEPSAAQVLMIAQHAKSVIDAHNREDANRNKQLMGTVVSLKSKLRNTRRSSRRRVCSMQHKRIKTKNQIKSLKHIRKLNKKDNDILEHVKNNPVLYDSIRNSMRPKKARRYTKQMQKFAVSLYLSGPRTYRMIQRTGVLCLPEKRTIKRWTNEVRYEPGLNRVILQKIEEKCRTFTEQEKIVVLAIDGMKIKSTLNYSAKSDVFHGFPDCGNKKRNERNKCSVLATEAVAVMVRGVYKPFKQV